jgi:hypothetical protein
MPHRLYRISRVGLWAGLLIALAYFLTPTAMLIAYADGKISSSLGLLLYPGPHDWVITAQGTNRLVGVTFGFYLAFLSAFGMYVSLGKDDLNPE